MVSGDSQGPGGARGQSHRLRPRLPVYSGTDAGEEALLPFSHSRSRPPGRRLGDMRPDGDGALWQGRVRVRRSQCGVGEGEAFGYAEGPGQRQAGVP